MQCPSVKYGLRKIRFTLFLVKYPVSKNSLPISVLSGRDIKSYQVRFTSDPKPISHAPEAETRVYIGYPVHVHESPEPSAPQPPLDNPCATRRVQLPCVQSASPIAQTAPHETARAVRTAGTPLPAWHLDRPKRTHTHARPRGLSRRPRRLGFSG